MSGLFQARFKIYKLQRTYQKSLLSVKIAVGTAFHRSDEYEPKSATFTISESLPALEHLCSLGAFYPRCLGR